MHHLVYLVQKRKNPRAGFEEGRKAIIIANAAYKSLKLNKVVKFMELIKDKKVAIMLGLGVQKYYEGAQIIRTIDSFAA